jgi:carbon storage regulator
MYTYVHIQERRLVMLVLSRNIGEEIVIGGRIRVFIVAVEGGKVRVGVEAPLSVRVDRREVHERRQIKPAGAVATNA